MDETKPKAMNTENLPAFLETVALSAGAIAAIGIIYFFFVRWAEKDKKVKRMFDERDIYK